MPTMMDIFNQRPFRAVELTTALNLVPPTPTLLGDMGERLFRTIRSRSRMVGIWKNGRNARLIPVSSIGAPPVELEKTGGEMRAFFTRRLAKGSTIYAEELQGVLQMPMFEAVASVQQEIASRAAQIREDFDLTMEHQRFGAVLGKVIDADGTTVLDDWYANWGVAEPTPFDFALDVSTTNLRAICDQVITAMIVASNGSWVNGVSTVHALCGDAFFTSLVSHPMIERTYLNYAAAAELRGELADTFVFGGITWHRFRGTDNGDFDIPSDTCRFFPMGAGDTFQKVLGPAEFFPFVNQPGQESYAMTIPDRDRDAWTRIEQYNYPLFACIRPEMLQRGVA